MCNEEIFEVRKKLAEQLNLKNGNLLGDYNCSKCKNRGFFYRVEKNEFGLPVDFIEECVCMKARRSIARLKKSGLENVIHEYTFENFNDEEPWQKTIKNAAFQYSKNPSGWLFIGGQSGSGKSHLCTAICRSFLLDGKQVLYMPWRESIERLKALSFDDEKRQKLMYDYKGAEVLYIDDFYKTGRSSDCGVPSPTPFEINVAFELLNFRRNNKSLLTIISSELMENEILAIDEGVGGRVFDSKNTKSMAIKRDKNRNYRIKPQNIV